MVPSAWPMADGDQRAAVLRHAAGDGQRQRPCGGDLQHRRLRPLALAGRQCRPAADAAARAARHLGGVGGALTASLVPLPDMRRSGCSASADAGTRRGSGWSCGRRFSAWSRRHHRRPGRGADHPAIGGPGADGHRRRDAAVAAQPRSGDGPVLTREKGPHRETGMGKGGVAPRAAPPCRKPPAFGSVKRPRRGGGMAQKPSRSSRLRSTLRARRTASAASRARRSDGFS